MARRHVSRFTGGGKRSDRLPQWLAINVNLVSVAGNAKVLASVLNAGALALRPFTIVRTRALFQVESDQTAASETTRGAVGMAVVSEQATTAGIASVPGPHSDADASAWFVWEPFINSFLFVSGVGFDEPAGSSFQIDSKAMRKVGPNEDVALVFEVEGTPGAVMTMQGRFLVKLH